MYSSCRQGLCMSECRVCRSPGAGGCKLPDLGGSGRAICAINRWAISLALVVSLSSLKCKHVRNNKWEFLGFSFNSGADWKRNGCSPAIRSHQKTAQFSLADIQGWHLLSDVWSANISFQETRDPDFFFPFCGTVLSVSVSFSKITFWKNSILREKIINREASNWCICIFRAVT